MGVSISWFLSVLNKMMVHQIYTLPETMKTCLFPSILERDGGEDSRTMKLQTKKPFLKTSTTVNSLVTDKNKGEANLDFEAATLSSPKELDVAAIKVQKVYKSYRTRRNLADSLDFDSSAASRWARATTTAALVGKGLSKDKKAQKLALQHWLEAIDPRHRYGHNLRLYYDIWYGSKSTQPFFYWLDVGDGKELNLEGCPRINLQSQCVKYLGLKEREAYEVIVQNGKLLYKQSRLPLNTDGDSKWIFVLSTSRALYVGQKIKGVFHHSSFLSGGAATAAGRLFASDGILKAVWPYSGHYLPTEDNFMEFINFLEEHHVDLSNVERCAVDDDTTS